MRKNVSPQKIVDALKELSFPNTFNPYTERCPVYDRSDSARIRSLILHDMLVAASDVEIDAIWIGRDLGHRGGRRTGLALTDDVRFSSHMVRWGVQFERPTNGPVVKERTASVVWDLLDEISEPVFLWNVFPLHPFPSGDEFRNRAHNSAERRSGEMIMEMLIHLLRPRRIVAIGGDAARVSERNFDDIDIFHVRHPSYGGEREFRDQVADLYELENTSEPTLI